MSPAGGSPRVLLACDFHLRYSTRLAAGLDRAGAASALLTRDHDLEFGGEPGAALAFVRETVGPGVPVSTIPGRLRSLAGWRQALALRRALRRWDPAVVHVQESIGNDPRLLLAAGIRRGRYAVTIHDPVRHPGDRNSARIAWLNRTLARQAGLIFVHGESLRDELVEIAAPRAPIVVVPHGIEVGEATPLPAVPSLLFFGRITEYKGLETLLEAMPIIWEELPEARLTIAGEGEIPRRPALADPRVVVRDGYIPEGEVPDLIKASTCVVLPYRQASQSGVGSLVKPYARPLVVTEVGGLPELVADGSGLAVPAGDPAALAAALRSVLTDHGLAERLGGVGAATAAREGSWDAVAVRTLGAYRDLLGVG
ncbi:MAG TPA: glycosyltransferase family 4 protein [Solirubrobacterales bacterium]